MSTTGGAVPGTSVPSGSLVSPGGAQGVGGLQGPGGPNAVSGDAGNQATLGSDSKIFVPDPTPVITSVRLRSFNAIGNPTFECNQRSPGTSLAWGAGTGNYSPLDRWQLLKSDSGSAGSSSQVPGIVNVPGTNFAVTSQILNITLTTQYLTALGAGDYLNLVHFVEGPNLRELINDVHSMQILAKCTSAITFTLYIHSAGSPFYSITKLCSISANQWTLVRLPNLPIWAAGATWSVAAGSPGYTMGIGLAAGANNTSPANDAWVSGNFTVGPGSTNFVALPNGTVFSLAFIQHEPGPVCTTLIDKPFPQNYDECLRYFQKTYDYGVKPGSVSSNGALGLTTISPGTTNLYVPVRFRKPMAKAPTVYNYSTDGTPNAINTGPGTNVGISSYVGVGTDGFGGWIMASAPNAGWASLTHYTADTGW